LQTKFKFSTQFDNSRCRITAT